MLTAPTIGARCPRTRAQPLLACARGHPSPYPMPSVAIRVSARGAEAKAVADPLAGGEVEDAQRPGTKAERRHEPGVAVGRPGRAAGRTARARADRIGEGNPPASRPPLALDVHDAGVDARRAHRVEHARQAQGLDLGVGIVLARHGEVAHRPDQPQRAAARDAGGEVDGLVRRRALPAQAGVDLEVHADPCAGAGRGGLEQLDAALVVHDRLEVVLDDGGRLVGADPPQQQDRAIDTGRAQLGALVDRGHRQALDPIGDERPRDRDGAVAVGVRLHDADHLACPARRGGRRPGSRGSPRGRPRSTLGAGFRGTVTALDRRAASRSPRAGARRCRAP